ncbi:MFS transporter [Streptomyces sp. NPDC004579]|uniref:MFS transporter n=1 Tax=Streptomyces sp. NPDC004579 TaxID=3154667 RepID=UPI0033BF0D30
MGTSKTTTARAARAARSVPGKKRFWFLWGGQSAGLLGDQMVPIALAAWIVQSPHHSASALGLVLAGRALALALFVPLGGVIADRYPRTRVMMACDLVRFLGVGALVLVPADTPAAALAACTFVLGAGEAFFRPAFRALVPSLVEPDKLPWANSLTSIATTSSGLAGPALGGLLVAFATYRAALVADLVTFALSTLTLLALGRGRPADPAAARASVLHQAREGVRVVVKRRWVFAVLLTDIAHVLLAVAPWLVLLPTISVREFGPRGYGFLLGAFALGGLAGGLAVMRHRPRRPGLTALCAQILFVGPLLTLLVPGIGLVPLLVVYAVAGAGSEYNTVLWTAALQRAYPDRLLGRVMALSSLASTVLMPIGLAVTGAVAAVTGPAVLLVTGAVVIAATTLAALLVPGVARFADPDPGPDLARVPPVQAGAS